MSQEIDLGELSLTDPPTDCANDDKRLRWFELSLVLLISFGQFFASSLYLFTNGRSSPSYLQNSNWTVGFFHELTSLFLLGYVLSRRKVRFRDLGLRWSFRDLRSGLAVAVASYVAYAVGLSFVHSLHRALFASSPSGPTAHDIFGHPSIAAIPYFLLNPFFEEMIVRAFLMTQVKDLTQSWTLATVLSVALQSSYHLYYGWEGVLGVSLQFLVFSTYYARTRRATPIVVAHAIFDIYGLVRLW